MEKVWISELFLKFQIHSLLQGQLEKLDLEYHCLKWQLKCAMELLKLILL